MGIKNKFFNRAWHLCFGILFLFVFIFVGIASAQTIITNQAQTTYRDSSGNSYGPVSSNIVSVTKSGGSGPVISIKVTLEGTSNFSSSITIVAKLAGASTVVANILGTTDGAGNLSVVSPATLISNQRYDLVLKVPYRLSRKISNVLWPPSTALTFSQLLAGNLNDSDNMINTLDWSVMNSKWRTNDAVADINKDGQVNTIDWGIMNKNWRLAGEE